MESHLESGNASENAGSTQVRKWLPHSAKSRYPVKSAAEAATRFLDSARNDAKISLQ
jgi:hypothetical protein